MSGGQAPYSEGFDNPTMDNIFSNLLKTPAFTHTATRKPTGNSSIPAETSMIGGQVAFLEQILLDQGATVDSLMDTAKKLGPIAQVAATSEDAYDAAFESDIAGTLPNKSGSLQGFTLIFFYLSLFCLAVVSSITVNQVTGLTSSAVTSFTIFMIIMVLSTAVIIRYG
jgi:hypothetical protein